VLLTSASKGEGVSYVSERLSLYLTKTYGHKVLYVNIADQMAAPEAPAAPGPQEIVSRLTSGEGLDGLVLASNVPGLHVLSLNVSEGQHALPWLQPELNAMETLLAYARDRFDVVILDAQSVLTAPWTATMAKPVAVTLLVCRFAITRREVLGTLLDAFKAADVTPRGVILNARRYSVPQALYTLLK
jgi:tyrosine-protein kinase Etk/Wzc